MARRRREPWPWALAGILVASAAVLASFWALAATHPDPLVVDDAYAAGLRYNAERRALRRGEALGVDLRVELARDAEGVAVRASLRGPDGAPVAAERVVARRERPAEGGLDRDFPLARAERGWRARVPLPRPGRWRLRVTATVDGAPVRRVLRVWR